LVALSSFPVFCTGCAIFGFDQPRTRVGSYASPAPGTFYTDVKHLGKHCYTNPLGEHNGIVYTCRGGHIDTAHVRIAADYVWYLYQLTNQALVTGNPQIKFKMNIEPSRYTATFRYPAWWHSLTPEKRAAISDEIAFELAQYFSYTLSCWHEVLTWYGYKSVGIFPEYPSAFSWEDNFSNIVGVKVGAAAVRDKKHDFDTALTLAIADELEMLGAESSQVSKYAAEKMKHIWYSGEVLVDMKERNMDLGYIDGYVHPTLVPGICEPAIPALYPVPTENVLKKYGFEMKLILEPKEMERRKILSIIYPHGKGKYVDPARDLPTIIEHIRLEALAKGYHVIP
jgi:hypothetical protein